MKKRYAILLSVATLWFLLWVQILGAAWNKDVPAATLGLNVSNPLILGNFAALETAIGANHDFSTGGTNSGKHTGVVLEEQSSVTTSANEMGFYCKDLGTAPGIYVRPQSDGTAIQWSDIAGKIVNAAMADDSIDSGQYVDASIDLAHLSVNSIDSDQYIDNSIDPAHLVDDFIFDTFPLSPSSAPDANYELANKKYVDDTYLAGQTVQVVNTQTGANTKDTGLTAIANNDDAPQNNEGLEVLTLAITPKSATNELKIEVSAFVESSSGTYRCAALFQDSIADALGSGQGNGIGAVINGISFTSYMVAGTTSEIIFKLRVGSDGTSVAINGTSSGRIYGGKMITSITITEIKV